MNIYQISGWENILCLKTIRKIIGTFNLKIWYVRKKTSPKTNKTPQTCKGTQTLEDTSAKDQIGSTYLICKKVY